MDPTSSLRIYYQNCRGLRTKLDDFYANCLNQNHDIICLSETWLHDAIENDKLFDDSYIIYRRDRDYERKNQTLGGGVLIAIKRNLIKSAEHRLQWNSDAEDIWVTLAFTNHKMHLCVAYLDQNIAVTTLQSHFSRLRYVNDKYSSNDIILVVGDYNLPQLFDIDGNRKTSYSEKYVEFNKTLDACQFQQYSRVCNTSSNILDLVLSNHDVIVIRKLEPFLVQEDPCHPTLEIRIGIDHSEHSSRHSSNSTVDFNRAQALNQQNQSVVQQSGPIRCQHCNYSPCNDNDITDITDSQIKNLNKIPRTTHKRQINVDCSSLSTSWAIVKCGETDNFCEQWLKFKSFKGEYDRNQTKLPNRVKKFRRDILDMCNDVESLLLTRVRKSPFYTIQIGDFSDIENFSILIVMVRYIFEKKIHEDLLFAKTQSFSENETFSYLAEKLDWKNCVGVSVTTEDLTQKISPNIKPLYTLMRRAAFVKHHFGDEFNSLMAFINAKVNIFKNSADDMHPGFEQILFNTNEYWLSHVKNLPDMFKVIRTPDVAPGWNIIFELLHVLNNDLHERLNETNISVFDIYDQIDHIKEKFKTIPNNPNLAVDTPEKFEMSITNICQGLDKYSPFSSDEFKNCKWIKTPFSKSQARPAVLSDEAKITFAALRQVKAMEDTFKSTKNLEDFWINALDEYPDVAKPALKQLLLFKNSQLCELAFAKFVDIRTKYLTDKKSEIEYLRLQLSPIEPTQIT